jgi:hypothetical protein
MNSSIIISYDRVHSSIAYCADCNSEEPANLKECKAGCANMQSAIKVKKPLYLIPSRKTAVAKTK